MKKLLLTLILFISAGLIFGQTLSLSGEHGSIESGSTVYVIGDPADDIITVNIDVTNNGSETVTVWARKVEVDVLEGTSNYFCWGACYPPFVYVSPQSVVIEPDSTTDEFFGDYSPINIIGKSTIMYSWWLDSNPSDSVYVYVEFNASPAGIEDPGTLASLSVYPNPAKESVTFDFDMQSAPLGSEIIISNLLGAVVNRVVIDNNTGMKSISVTELKDGIYFYNFVNGNRSLKTGKFIVRH